VVIFWHVKTCSQPQAQWDVRSGAILRRESLLQGGIKVYVGILRPADLGDIGRELGLTMAWGWKEMEGYWHSSRIFKFWSF